MIDGYIAINRFTINNDRQEEFEEIWTNRERYLKSTPGFIKFQLLRGTEKDGKRDYLSHSTWKSEKYFVEWTQSENFKKAHKNRTPEGIIVGPPRFDGYDVILEE